MCAQPSVPVRHSILLLTTAHSYRNQAFSAAAERLGITILPVVHMPQELAAQQQKVIGVDFNQPDAAAATLAAFGAEAKVDAVLAVDDSGTLVAAKTAALLGLHHNDPDAAHAARDKFVMRRRMAAAGVPCPWFVRVETTEDARQVAAGAPLPCVVKPLALNGSRGVIRADTPTEFVAAVGRLQQLLQLEYPDQTTHSYLVEAFIPGVEVALEGMLDDGQLTLLALFDKPDPLDGPFFEETIYVTPSRLPAATQAAIGACAEAAARAVGLRTGPVHAELRVNDQGPWMLEIAGRSIGGLCSQTLRFGLDGSLEELILRQACGLPRDTRRREQASGVMMIPIPQAGILRQVRGVEAARALPGVDRVEITAKLHYGIKPLPEGESYLGFILARGPTPAQVEATLRTAHAQLEFTIVPEFDLTLGERDISTRSSVA